MRAGEEIATSLGRAMTRAGERKIKAGQDF